MHLGQQTTWWKCNTSLERAWRSRFGEGIYGVSATTEKYMAHRIGSRRAGDCVLRTGRSAANIAEISGAPDGYD